MVIVGRLEDGPGGLGRSGPVDGFAAQALYTRSRGADTRNVSTLAADAAVRAVDVLPRRASRRMTRRDGLLPVVFVVELLAGVAFGLAAHSGHSSLGDAAQQAPFVPTTRMTVVAQATTPISVQPQVRRHAPRNPFGSLVRTAP